MSMLKPVEAPKELSKRKSRHSNRRIPLNLSERKLLLAGGDIVIICGVLLLFIVVRSETPFDWTTIWDHLYWFGILAAIWLIAGLYVKAFHLPMAASPFRSAWLGSITALVTASVYMLIPRITFDIPNNRADILVFPVLMIIFIALWRIVYALVFGHVVFQRRAVIVGAGEPGREVEQMLDRLGRNGYTLLGFVENDAKNWGAISAETSASTILGSTADLPSIITTHHPNEIILAVEPSELSPGLFESLMVCREAGVPIVSMSHLFEIATGRVPVEHAGQDISLVMDSSTSSMRHFYTGMRRVGDLLFAAIGCLFLLGLMPIIWLANRFTDPGDLFYRQERVGKNGEPFNVIKFRSMVMDAEKYSGAVWAQEDDPRITAVGNFLRKTRLDEIPQFWNVMKGEMSMIGPRPERPEFVDQLAEEIPYYRLRHAVKPGITGWAQVKYRYGASVEDALRKLEYDLYYIKHEGPYLDFLTLLKTVQVTLGMEGR